MSSTNQPAFACLHGRSGVCGRMLGASVRDLSVTSRATAAHQAECLKMGSHGGGAGPREPQGEGAWQLAAGSQELAMSAMV